MAKIAQISAKYIIHSSITIDGLVDRPDVIGAIFGQTEGLLGNDLELRELQRSGRIGRIEVNVTGKNGKSQGEIIIPSSLDKAETAIVGAALEIIQRIGPCNAKIHVEKIEDIRISKRQYVLERAKELLRTLMDDVMPDSQELSDEVAYSVRVMEIREWGRDQLPAGPAIEDSEEIILVEGRADVLNLLKHGFKNVIAMNGTQIPDSIKELCREKLVTAFVDGDRGGDLIVKELMETTEIDFVTKAPDGKEVEELAKKEIHKSLRARIAAEQFKMDTRGGISAINARRTQTEDELSHDVVDQAPRARQTPQRAPERRDDAPRRDDRRDVAPRRDDRRDVAPRRDAPPRRDDRREASPAPSKPSVLTDSAKIHMGKLLEDLLGTHGAYVLDANLKILGKVPGTELVSTIRALKSGMHAVVFDGQIAKELITTCEQANIPFIVGMSASAKGTVAQVLTAEELL